MLALRAWDAWAASPVKSPVRTPRRGTGWRRVSWTPWSPWVVRRRPTEEVIPADESETAGLDRASTGSTVSVADGELFDPVGVDGIDERARLAAGFGDGVEVVDEPGSHVVGGEVLAR